MQLGWPAALVMVGLAACQFDPSARSAGDAIDGDSRPAGSDASPASQAPADGSVSEPVAPVGACPDRCPGACNEQGACIIICAFDRPCDERVLCPVGLPCDVYCAAGGSCGGGIDCTGSTSCMVRCSGEGSCAGPIACGAGACDVRCNDSAGACTGGVACADSCRCGVSCSDDSCGAMDCPLGCEDDDGCRDQSGSDCSPTC